LLWGYVVGVQEALLQKFTDEITRDWGGKVYTDLINACDYAIKNFNFIDAKNTFAAGASYGGYMINWIAGHTDRFNALVCHAGDLTESSYEPLKSYG
jgi:dipeptidyl aminopeptidase/acylaminoacyl peptidase